MDCILILVLSWIGQREAKLVEKKKNTYGHKIEQTHVTLGAY